MVVDFVLLGSGQRQTGKTSQYLNVHAIECGIKQTL